MVHGKPGTGHTPLEKLLALIFSLWYLASIFPVILMYLSGSTKGVQVAILSPLLYHVMISVNAFLFLEKFNVCRPGVTSANGIGVIHAVLTVACVIIYRT